MKMDEYDFLIVSALAKVSAYQQDLQNRAIATMTSSPYETLKMLHAVLANYLSNLVINKPTLSKAAHFRVESFNCSLQLTSSTTLKTHSTLEYLFPPFYLHLRKKKKCWSSSLPRKQKPSNRKSPRV